MQYYNNILCVPGDKLIKRDDNSGIISVTTYKNWYNRGNIEVVKRSCFKTPALISFEKLPYWVQQELIQRYGNPHEVAEKKPFKDTIKPDADAVKFYTEYRLPDGRPLPEEFIQKYSNDAAILNAIRVIYEKNVNKRGAQASRLNKTKFFENAVLAVNDLRVEYPCTLPDGGRRLYDKYKEYVKYGYHALVSRKFCNDNSRKVSAMITNLLLSLYAMPNKPYANGMHDSVYIMYHQFINGDITVVDSNTGELFNPEDFKIKGQPVEISKSTVWNYINNPVNRAAVDKLRNTRHDYNTMHRPYQRRHVPKYTGSKISMDDRQLVHKMHNGLRPWAYYAMDVVSGAFIGYAHSKQKTEALFLDCLTNMFRMLNSFGYGVPMEVEVEHHLVSKYFDELGKMFPYIRICNPGNSIEKRAEHIIRAKKYGAEKAMLTGIGRHYAKLEANRVKTDQYTKEKYYTYDEIIANDIATIQAYNNELHPKQKLYPGKTRWQVFCENLNPNMPQIDKAIWYKVIGTPTKSSIRNNKFITVQGCEYMLPDPAVMTKLKPNNYNITAYWLPEADGSIPEVYIYQDDAYLCTCEKVKTYNESQAEQTEEDIANRLEQVKYDSRFDKMIKDSNSSRIKAVVIKNQELNELADMPVEIVEPAANFNKEENIEKLLAEYDPEEYRRKAYNEF